jgi:hypothetical protein
MSMAREYEDHYSGRAYDRPPAQGSIAVRPQALIGVMGGHTIESAPDLRSPAAVDAAKMRQEVLEILRGRRPSLSLNSHDHTGEPAFRLQEIEGTKVGIHSGIGGRIEGLETQYINHPTDSTRNALVEGWRLFGEAVLRETPTRSQGQLDHDAELKEAQIRAEMDAARSGQAQAQFAHALRLGQGHGRR